MADRTFTLPELASLVDVEYRTLHTWVRRGLLEASCQRAQGSGTRNLFDCGDALDAYVLADLRRAGVELSKLEAVAAELRRSRGERSERDEVLLINGTVSLSGYSSLREAVAHVSPTLVYDLAHARAGLDSRLETGSE
jgi:DNA-binding transcriptional MerR regulator